MMVQPTCISLLPLTSPNSHWCTLDTIVYHPLLATSSFLFIIHPQVMFKSPFDVTLHVLRLEQTELMFSYQLSVNQSVLIAGVMIMCYTPFLSVIIDKPQI